MSDRGKIRFTQALQQSVLTHEEGLIRSNLRKVTAALPPPYRIVADSANFRILKTLGWFADATDARIRIHSCLLREHFHRHTFASVKYTVFEEILHYIVEHTEFYESFGWQAAAKQELCNLNPLATKFLSAHRKATAFNGTEKSPLEDYKNYFLEHELLVDIVRIKYWLKEKGKSNDYVSHALTRAFPNTYCLIKHFEKDVREMARNIKTNGPER